MLHADVGHVAITHGVGFVAGDSHDHFAHVIGGKRTFFEEALEGIERGLNGRTHCPFLDICPRYLVALAEFLDQHCRIRFDHTIFPGSKGLEEIVGAGENVINACPTGSNQECCSDRAGRRFPAKEESLLHMFGISRPGSDS